MSDLLRAIQTSPPEGPFGAFTGDRNEGVRHFPGYRGMPADDQRIVNEVRENKRPSALIISGGSLILFEHQRAGVPFDGIYYGYTLRKLLLPEAMPTPTSPQSAHPRAVPAVPGVSERDSRPPEVPRPAPPQKRSQDAEDSSRTSDPTLAKPVPPPPVRDITPGGAGRIISMVLLGVTILGVGFCGGIALMQSRQREGSANEYQALIEHQNDTMTLLRELREDVKTAINQTSGSPGGDVGPADHAMIVQLSNEKAFLERQLTAIQSRLAEIDRLLNDR